MLPLSALSRRALVAAAGLVAVVPAAAEARKKPPQAFVMATFAFPFADSPTTFGVNFEAAFTAPASATAFGDFSGTISVSSQGSPARLRELIAAEVAEQAAAELASEGVTVPADRIAVTLL